jgi:hydroxyacylglutathione hydrolase
MMNEYMIVTGLDRCIFTGDTIFIGGAGRFFEGGTGAQMLKNFDLMLTLPDDMKIFCGHEYVEQNF